MNNELIQSSEFFEAIKPRIRSYEYMPAEMKLKLWVNVNGMDIDRELVLSYFNDDVELKYERKRFGLSKTLTGTIKDESVTKYFLKMLYEV